MFQPSGFFFKLALRSSGNYVCYGHYFIESVVVNFTMVCEFESIPDLTLFFIPVFSALSYFLCAQKCKNLSLLN